VAVKRACVSFVKITLHYELVLHVDGLLLRGAKAGWNREEMFDALKALFEDGTIGLSGCEIYLK
jgi:hypothetical protein